MHSLLHLLFLSGIIVISVCSGVTIARAFRLPRFTPLDTILLGLGLGLGVLTQSTGLMGLLHVLSPPGALMLLALMTAAAVPGARLLWTHCTTAATHGAEDAASGTWTYPKFLITAAFLGFGIVYLISTMAPPLDGDTLHSYLDIPRQYVRAGGIVSLPYELHATLPLNMQMLSAMALMISGDELAQMLVGFFMGLAAAGAVFIIGRRFISAEAGALGALLFYTTDVVQSLVPTTKVNLGWAFFDLLAIFAAGTWVLQKRSEWHLLVLSGIFSGLALGTQYSAGLTVIVLFAVVFAISLQRRERAVQSMAAYCLPVLLLGGIWLIRNFVEIGNPFYPIMNRLFGLPAAEPIEHATGVVGFFKTPWDMATGFIANRYGNPVGPLVLGMLPGLVLVRKANPNVKKAALLALALYFLWYLGVQRPRNLLSAIGLAALVSAYIAVELGSRNPFLRKTVLALVSLFLALNLGSYARTYLYNLQYYRYVVGIESRRDFLRRTLTSDSPWPSAAITDFINDRLPADAVVVALYLGNGYYISKPFLDSRMIDRDFMNDTCKDEPALLQAWKGARATHVFWNETYIRRVTESEPERWTDYKIVQDPEFKRQHLRLVIEDSTQSLYQVVY